jgi:phage shock protein E
MNWITLLVIGIAILAVIIWKRLSFLSAERALKYFQEGALLIDVRTVREYRAGHLAHAVNIPLDELEKKCTHLAKEKERVLLLHCFSGTRSGIAQGKLKSMGYPNIFNLGSYARAQKISEAWLTTQSRGSTSS